MHPVDQLFADMASVEPYPKGVVRVPERIPGVAFFPGGSGLWGAKQGSPLPPMPVGGIMVLGHDFHSEAGFKASLKQKTEVPDNPSSGYRTPPTWTGLRRLFEEAGIPLEKCFFTNAYMGLREGEGTMGRFPGSHDPQYKERCRRFVLRQIEAQRPSVILTLGTWVPEFIAPLAPKLSGWADAGSMQDIDASGAVVRGVRFAGADAPACTVAALTHPSLRGPNIGRRRYDGLEGHDAELQMLRDAMSEAQADRATPVARPASSVRSAITETYAQWTAMSALRSGAPIKSRRDVYTALRGVNFTPLFDRDRGAIDRVEFDRWHKSAVDDLIAREPRLVVGWAAKILNVYLKTRVYIGAEGRDCLQDVIHPPIDSGLWEGLQRRFADRTDILRNSNCVTLIKDITDHTCYSKIIKGCRAAADELGCSLIEVEQLWLGTELKEIVEST